MINTPENDLHRIFVKDVENLRDQLGLYLDKPFPTEELLSLMEAYSDRWAETCTKIYMRKYGLDTDEARY
jgi:hypothetical protein